MKYFIYTLIVGLLSIAMIYYVLTIDLEKKAVSDVNFALKHAVHDAALMVDETKLSDGKVIFDRAKSDQAFIATLTRNLPVNNSLQPQNNLLFKSPIKVIEKFYLDSTSKDPKTGLPLKFPFIYKYSNTALHISLDQPIFGPSVIYVIEAKLYGSDRVQQFITVQEYKG
ncbi:hypothetical protein [Priestia koreensis]|uniref:hypothetical protein n=1 Tax=Priestia koreensis TaxID=284581 RepID=UPI001F590919|nr:hypothetical protein [Priestia koreensis]UNL87500.1 hypothetical protein IE339_24600 [Priestia koreensis]